MQEDWSKEQRDKRKAIHQSHWERERERKGVWPLGQLRVRVRKEINECCCNIVLEKGSTHDEAHDGDAGGAQRKRERESNAPIGAFIISSASANLSLDDSNPSPSPSAT